MDIPYEKDKVLHKASGSMFDQTLPMVTKRPGTHQLNTRPVDDTAFTLRKSSTKVSPKNFLKKGAGLRRPASPELSAKPKARLPKESMKKRANPPNTKTRQFYEKGDLPVQIDHPAGLQWKIEVEKLDFSRYLPMFVDGIREVEEPYSLIAKQGTLTMLEHGGHKVVPVIPQLIMPIKHALETRDPKVMVKALHVIQKLVDAHELVGQALVPYYRHLLPTLNIFATTNQNLGDGIEYSQRRQANLGDLIDETLRKLEMHGGPDAFINIKYMIPTYQSALPKGE